MGWTDWWCSGRMNPYTAERRDVSENTPPEAQEISLRRGFCTRGKSWTLWLSSSLQCIAGTISTFSARGCVPDIRPRECTGREEKEKFVCLPSIGKFNDEIHLPMSLGSFSGSCHELSFYAFVHIMSIQNLVIFWAKNFQKGTKRKCCGFLKFISES